MSKRSEDALIALRRIQRVTELASKRLARTAGLNPSQLSVLRILSWASWVSGQRMHRIQVRILNIRDARQGLTYTPPLGGM